MNWLCAGSKCAFLDFDISEMRKLLSEPFAITTGCRARGSWLRKCVSTPGVQSPCAVSWATRSVPKKQEAGVKHDASLDDSTGFANLGGLRMKPNFRILVIDDEKIVCDRLSMELEREGFAVEAVDFIPKPFKMSKLRELVLRLAAE